MPPLTTAQKRRNARRALAHTAMGRASEAPGKVEHATSTFTNPVAESRRSSPSPEPRVNTIGRDDSTIVGESSTRQEFNRPLPEPKPKQPRLARARPVSTYHPPVEQGEPTTIGGGEVPGTARLHEAATNRRQNKPANYKLHVLSALALAISIRIVKYGAKALTG